MKDMKLQINDAHHPNIHGLFSLVLTRYCVIPAAANVTEPVQGAELKEFCKPASWENQPKLKIHTHSAYNPNFQRCVPPITAVEEYDEEIMKDIKKY